MSEPTPPLTVEVWTDVVCPWCAIGLADLDAAIAALDPPVDVQVVLRSFLLDPRGITRTPEGHTEAIAAKYGTSVGAIRAGQARITGRAAAAGLDLRLDRVVGGSTLDAHRLLHLAQERGVQRRLEERVRRAVLTDGEPVADHDVLRRAASDVGLDLAEVDDALASDAYADAVAADVAAARDLDVTGVPFFLVDGHLALAGAHPPDALGRVLTRAAAA